MAAARGGASLGVGRVGAVNSVATAVKSEFFFAAGSCAKKNHRLAGANRALRDQFIEISSPQSRLKGMNTSLIAIPLLSVAGLAADAAGVQRELELEPPDAPSRMPSVEESELEAGFGLAEDSRPGPTGLAEISYTEQRTSASL